MTERGPDSARTAPDLEASNREYYDALWAEARLVEPERFNTWPLVGSLAGDARLRLEVAPGLRPRLPIAGNCFVDISMPALERLRARGARAVLGPVTALPLPAAAFDLVCAFDIVEHVDDDDGALSELARVTAPGGVFLLSTPLHMARWTAFDDFVGHRRRYDPRVLLAKLEGNGLSVERSAAYGMQPRSSRLLDFGMWHLTHRRERAMWWYNHVIMPLALRFEKKLVLVDGMIDTDRADEVLLVCRKLRA